MITSADPFSAAHAAPPLAGDKEFSSQNEIRVSREQRHPVDFTDLRRLSSASLCSAREV